MKLIGVMGNGGSGKTTFTGHLGKRDNVGVIHIDDLVGEVKKKYFKMFLQAKENNTTETTKSNPKLKSGAKIIFYKNRFAFKFLMALRSKLIEKDLNRKIEEYKNSGKDLVVIDDWVLPTHKKLYSNLNHIYTVERPYLSRRKGIQERDALTTTELKVNDLPYALEFLKQANGPNTSVITNNGTISDLENKADQVYEHMVEPTFDEKYSCRNSVDIKAAIQDLSTIQKREIEVRGE